MPRHTRSVFAGIPHHVTQRGNRGERIFFDDADRAAYLAWLAFYSEKFAMRVAAYCLMDNHVHIVATPTAADGLERVFRPLHTRYAQHVNRRRGWSGHLLQGRYFSSPLDPAHYMAAVRYVERNPVRSGIVRRAEQYRWSSAAARCGLRSDPLLAPIGGWTDPLGGIEDWSAWLAEVDCPAQIDRLRRHADSNLPCGEAAFVRGLSDAVGRVLASRPVGRPGRICGE